MRIYSDDIGLKFVIEKCAMLIMKSGKRHMTEGIKSRKIENVRRKRNRIRNFCSCFAWVLKGLVPFYDMIFVRYWKLRQRRNRVKDIRDFSPEETMDNSITEFKYCPEKGITFPSYFRRYADLYKKEMEKLDRRKKIWLILPKHGTNEKNKFRNFEIPRETDDISFEKKRIFCRIFFCERN